jgi:iron complex transport system permease protein
MFSKPNYLLGLLLALLLLVLLAAIAWGAVPIGIEDMLGAIGHAMKAEPAANIREGVFWELRLPRVLLCAITGAILSVSGVLMQGLFRNPIVEPGLIGTSSGAAFGASIVFVLGAALPPAFKAGLGPLLVPLFAFGGALLATYAVYALGKSTGRMQTVSLLLTGIAINALGISGTGFMSYIARDPQARSITFWSMGSFSGASWAQVGWVGLAAFIGCTVALRYAKQLNALLLGESEAIYLGIDPRKLQRRILLINTAMVAIATAFVGVISFMGLIVPHLLRLILGSDNRKILPASMIAGAMLLTLTDLVARLLVAPAEIPIGIITSLVGAPVFILLLKRAQLIQKGGDHA